MTIRCRNQKPGLTMKMLSMPVTRARRYLAVGLVAALSVLTASPVLAGVKTWDQSGGSGNNNWNVANNWDTDGIPGTGDSALFDGSVVGVTTVDKVLNANFTIQGLEIKNIGKNNWNVLTLNSTYKLTLQDDTDNAVFIEFDSSPNNYHAVLTAPIVFNDPLTITKTGGGNELKIQTSVTGGANGVTFNGGSLSETILFFTGSSMSWSGTTTVEQGRVGINNAASMQIGSAGLNVTMATVGDAEIQWRPLQGTSLANDNNFILGTAGKSWFDMFRGFSSATTLTLEGNFTGGATGVTLDFSVSQQTIATDTFVLTGDLNVDSQLRFLVGAGTPPNGTMRLNGTITKADGGVLIESGADLDGSGTITFTLASATTTGPTNLGDLPIDLKGALDISAMTADFTGSTVDGVSDYPLIAIDPAATLTGEFASETALPAGYEIQYTATEVKLVFVPGAPLSTDDDITIDEDTPTALSTDDFGTYNANGGDPFAEVKITTIESAGDLEYDTTGAGAWADVTLDQVIGTTHITAGRLRFSPAADANGSPYATIGFKVGNGTEFSSAEYTLTVHVTPVQDTPTASDNTVETAKDTDYTFAVGDFNFADVDTSDSLTKIQVTQLETVGDLKLSGGDVTLNQEILVADLTAGNLKYTPLAGQTGSPYDTFEFKVRDGTEYSASAYTLTVNVTGPALPANLTWDNGAANGLWDTTSQNWSGTATWNNGGPDTAVFGATGVGTVTLAENITSGAVTFNTAGYTIAGGGNTLTMQGDLTANESATISAPVYLSVVDDLQSWVVANGKTLTLSDVTGQSGVRLNIMTTGDGNSNILNLNGALDLQGSRIILNGTRLDYSASGSIVSANNYVILGHTLNTTMNVTGGSLAINAGTGKITIGTKSTSTVTVSSGTLSLTTTGASEKGVTIGGDWQVGDGGAGVLTVSGSGLVQISGTDITFGKGTGVGACSGTLNLDGGAIETAASFILGTSAPVGTGTVNFNGGTLRATGAKADWIGAGIVCNVRTGGAVIDTQSYNMGIARALADGGGGGGLTKRGGGTLTLTGANTYTGDTKVEGGTLSINSAYLADGADVYLTGGTTFNLNHAGTDTIRSLYIDGVLQFPGTWGAIGSGAEHQNAMFTGAGKLNVTAGSASCIIADFNDSPGVLPPTIPTEANLDDGSPHGSWTIIQRGATAPPDGGNGHTAIKSYSDAAGDHYLEIDKSPTAGVAPEYDLAFDSTVPPDGTYVVSFDIINHRVGPSGSGADKTDLIVGYDASGDVLFQIIIDADTESATYLGVGVVGQTTSSETVNNVAYNVSPATTDMTTIGVTLGAATFDVTVGGNVAYTGISYDSVVTDLSRLKFTAMDPNKQFAGYSVDNIRVGAPQATSSTGTIFLFK